MKSVCVLGSNSGQNLGDVAILHSIIDNIRRLRPDTVFEVPAHSDRYLRHKYDSDVVHWVRLGLHTLSLVRPKVFRAIHRSDVVLITDGIIFDVRLFNPNFNWLLSLIFVIPLARLLNKRVVGLLVEVGPLYTGPGRFLAGLVCKLCDELMVREPLSVTTLKELGVRSSAISVYADAAFVTEDVPDYRRREVLAQMPFDDTNTVIGLNVNSYFDQWLCPTARTLDRERFLAELAGGLDLVIERLDVRVAVVITQTNDRNTAELVIERIQHRGKVALIDSASRTPADLQLMIGNMRAFVGMRLHSLIFACAMNTPCVGLIYSPRVRNLMQLMGMESLQMELEEVEREALFGKISDCLENAEEIRACLRERAQRMREKAITGFEHFCTRHLV